METTWLRYIHTYVSLVYSNDINFVIVQLCYGVLCLPFQYEPKKDVFNAAQSGAMITNVIKREFSYLIEQIREVAIFIYS